MKVIDSIASMREYSWVQRKIGKKIGFIPTMGYLHQGHLTLVKEAREKVDNTVVSIYVNPTQFNNSDDFQNYPKNLKEDIIKLENSGVDILFIPKTEEVYPEGERDSIQIRIPSLMKNLCAPFRPGHFEGVLQIVTKLFNIVQPDLAVFGLKDYQQFLIIQKLVELLDIPIEVMGVETLRENSGIAMSSRNARLTSEELSEATLLFRALCMGRDYAKKKNTTPNELEKFIKEILLSSSRIRMEYIQILDARTLQEKTNLSGNLLLAGAIYIGNVRLIDNIRFTI